MLGMEYTTPTPVIISDIDGVVFRVFDAVNLAMYERFGVPIPSVSSIPTYDMARYLLQILEDSAEYPAGYKGRLPTYNEMEGFVHSAVGRFADCLEFARLDAVYSLKAVLIDSVRPYLEFITSRSDSEARRKTAPFLSAVGLNPQKVVMGLDRAGKMHHVLSVCARDPRRPVLYIEDDPFVIDSLVSVFATSAPNLGILAPKYPWNSRLSKAGLPLLTYFTPGIIINAIEDIQNSITVCNQ